MAAASSPHGLPLPTRTTAGAPAGHMSTSGAAGGTGLGAGATGGYSPAGDADGGTGGLASPGGTAAAFAKMPLSVQEIDVPALERLFVQREFRVVAKAATDALNVIQRVRQHSPEHPLPPLKLSDAAHCPGGAECPCQRLAVLFLQCIHELREVSRVTFLEEWVRQHCPAMPFDLSFVWLRLYIAHGRADDAQRFVDEFIEEQLVAAAAGQPVSEKFPAFASLYVKHILLAQQKRKEIGDFMHRAGHLLPADVQAHYWKCVHDPAMTSPKSGRKHPSAERGPQDDPPPTGLQTLTAFVVTNPGLVLGLGIVAVAGIVGGGYRAYKYFAQPKLTSAVVAAAAGAVAASAAQPPK